jgi:malate synthase
LERRSQVTHPDGVEVLGPIEGRFAEILSDDALGFLAGLHREFEARRRELLVARAERQDRLDAGERPDFSEATRAVRDADWRVAPPPADLRDRRVEITGPTDR